MRVDVGMQVVSCWIDDSALWRIDLTDAGAESTAVLRIRLVIIEDQELIRQSMAIAVGGRLPVDIVGSFASGRDALADPATLQSAQCGLIDFRLPREDPRKLTGEIRRLAPALKLIWVTSVVEDYLLHQALASELPGFVHKEDNLDVLTTAIQRVHAGHTYISERVKGMVAALRVQPDHYEKILSPREQEVLSLLGSGLSNEEAGAIMGLSPGTLQAHRRNLMARLNLHSAAELVAYALGRGFTRHDDLRCSKPPPRLR